MQDRARRVQRHNADSGEMPFIGVSELRITDGALDGRGKDGRGGIGIPAVPQKEPAPAPPVPPVKKSGLGRQFGRLGGAVSRKNQRP